MGKSLADQLLGAGLVDEKKLKKAKQDKRKAKKLAKSGGEVATDDTGARIQAEREAQAQRDRELNRQREAVEREKALRAQAMQMLAQHQQPHDGEITFNFIDPRSNKVKNILVDTHVQSHLAKGNLAICAWQDKQEKYVIVPKNIADKVAERFADAVIFVADQNTTEVAAEDDPYKDYQIPDDLMW